MTNSLRNDNVKGRTKDLGDERGHSKKKEGEEGQSVA